MMDEMFITNHYKVLEVMYKNKIMIANEEYCPVGQSEIAEELGLSRVIVNRIFAQLKAAGYISMITRGKWKLSDKAINMIQVTQKL